MGALSAVMILSDGDSVIRTKNRVASFGSKIRRDNPVFISNARPERLP